MARQQVRSLRTSSLNLGHLVHSHEVVFYEPVCGKPAQHRKPRKTVLFRCFSQPLGSDRSPEPGDLASQFANQTRQ